MSIRIAISSFFVAALGSNVAAAQAPDVAPPQQQTAPVPTLAPVVTTAPPPGPASGVQTPPPGGITVPPSPEGTPGTIPPATPGAAVGGELSGQPGTTSSQSVATIDTPEPTNQVDTSLDWAKTIRLGAGATLWYYQPLLDGAKNDLSFFNARFTADATWGAFGFHLEPRFRDTKLRSYFDGPVWLQEGYASFTAGPVVVKVGKEYSRLGLFWDNSFYGNVQVYDGLKLAPDYGVSVEGAVGDPLGLRFYAQYFLVDGRTNVALPTRDTIAITGARRRDELVGRLEPYFEFEGGEVALGLSAQAFRADFGDSEDHVQRYAADVKLTYAGLGVWGEYLRQNGRHVNGFPYPAVPGDGTTDPIAGRSSGHNDYVLLGGEYTLHGFTARYNVSLGSYKDVSVKEWMHVPAIGYAINKNLSLLGELVLWRRHAPEGDSDVDKSLNFTLNATL